MVVKTDTAQVHKARKDMIEFLLSNHPLDCPVCDKGGECELQDMTFRYGLDHSRFTEEKLHYPEEQWSPLVFYDAPRCILCFRCVRVCDEGMDVKALGVGARGVHSVILPNEKGAARLRRMRHVHRYLPGRRAHQRNLSLSDAPVGNDLRPRALHALLERMQNHAERSQQRNPARQQSRSFRHQRRVSLRQRTFRLRFHTQSGTHPPAAHSPQWQTRAGQLGRRARRSFAALETSARHARPGGHRRDRLESHHQRRKLLC